MATQKEVADAIAKLRAGRESTVLDDINAELAVMFKDLFAVSDYDLTDPTSAAALYLQGVKLGFYNKKSQVVNPKYRECALIALLAAQQGEANLAFHVFIAMMAGISVDDVVDIVFLTGIYCGANILTKSLAVVSKTFAAVKTLGDQRDTPDARTMLKAVRDAFGSQAPPSPPAGGGGSGRAF